MLSLQKTSVGGPFTPANVAGIRQAQAAFDSAVMSTRAFTMEHVAMTNSVEKFGKQLSAGKLGLGNYYKIWRDSARGVSAELDALAISQARLNRSIAIADPLRPGYAKLVTDINGVVTAQEKAIFYQRALNTALLQGSTKLIDFGKNMQWAGRQMMVGLTMPLAMFGAAASHMFLNFDKEMNSMLKVYGAHAVVQSQQTLDAIRKQVTDLASNLARTIGVTMTDTATIAKTFSSIGLEGKDLVRTTEATARLMRLGDIEAKNAGTAMVSLQNVFKLQSDQMADAVNFLNAAKHSTSTTMQDIIEAIPRVGPILQQMGGTYRDFVTLLVGMRESGVPAAQAANAMKSMFASIENPTRRAVDLFNSLKINLKGIVEQNQNNPLQMVLELQKALDTLPSLQRRQAIENLFGKFQFARVEALLSNLGKTGSQTEKVLELYGKSTGEIAAVAKQEIDVAAKGSPAANFLRMKATLQADLMPIGRQFLTAITTIGNAFDKILKVFKALGPVSKFLITALTFTAVIGPIIMLVGLFSNLAGQIFKAANYVRMFIVGANAASPSQNRFLAGIQNMRNFYQDLDKSTIAARNQMELMPEAITSNAEAFEILRRSIQDLTEQFLALGVAQREAMMAGGGVIPGFPRPPGFAGGIVGIPGTGSGDTYPAMLTPGESVMTVEATKQFGPTLQAMNAGVIPGFQTGFIPPTGGLRAEYLGTPGKYSAPSALSGAGRYILSQAGELESGISIIRTAISQFNESVMQGTGAFAHLTEAQRANILITERQAAAMTQADLAHAQSASWMGRQKVWKPEELYGAYGVENNPLRRFSGTGPSAQFFGRYLEEGKNQLIQAGVATEEELTRVANQIRQGMHPLTTESVQLVNAAYTAIQRDVENATLQIAKVTSLNAGTISSSAYKEAVIASEVSSARLSGMLTRPEQQLSLQAAAEQSVIRMQESVLVGIKKGLGIASPSVEGAATGLNYSTTLNASVQEGLAKGAAGIEEESALIGQKIKAGLEEGAASTGKPRFGMGMRMGGSMGVMMGGSMLGSSIGGTTGSAISTSAMIGSMGMMMGASMPVVGALFALGAAIPLVTNAFKKMAEDNRIAHNSMMSSLKMSANAAAYFGLKFTPLSDYDFSSVKDSLEQHKKSIQENKDAIDKLTASYKNASDQETKDLVASVKKSSSKSELQDIVNRKYLSDIAGGMTAQQATQDMVSILRAGGRSVFEIQRAKANLPQETAYAGSLATGKQDVSTASVAFNKQIEQQVQNFKSYTKTVAGLRLDTAATTKGQAENAAQMISGLASTDPMHMKALLDNLSPVNAKLLQSKEIFQKVAETIASGDKETIGFANDLRKGGVSTQNMSLALIAVALKAGTASEALDALTKGNFQAWLDNAIKSTGALNDALGKTGDGKDKKLEPAGAPDYSKMYEPYTRQYEDLISLMKKRVDAQKAYNDELKRTQEYHNKQLDFFNQFKDAMTSGNYLKAIQAQQGAVANQANFNSELKQSKEERLLSYVESRKALIEQAIQRGIAPAEFLKQNKGFHLNIDSKYMTDLLGGVSKAAYTKSLNSYTSQLISLQNQSMNETSGQTFQNLVINVDTSNSVVPDQFAKQIIDNVTGAVSNATNKNNVSNSVTSGSSSRGNPPKISPTAGYVSSGDFYKTNSYTSSADFYKPQSNSGTYTPSYKRPVAPDRS